MTELKSDDPDDKLKFGIFEYLKFRLFAVCLFLSSLFILSMMMILSGINSSYTRYAVLVSSFIAIIFFVFDYIKYKNKLKFLHDIKENLYLLDEGNFDIDNIIESGYLDIINTLYKKTKSDENFFTEKNAQIVDYYTMWLHQIKTPISAMYLAADSKEFRSEIFKMELFNIEQYVQMALAYARLDGGITDIVLEKIDIDKTLKSSLKKYSSLFIYKKLSLDYSDINITVLSDQKWLAFIFEQLLSNALKYTFDYGITLGWEDNSIVISDTGIGINSDDLARIFERGYTGYNGRIEQKSSGLGLYMAKKAAKKLGLELKITSVKGVGTTAKICFPKDFIC